MKNVTKALSLTLFSVLSIMFSNTAVAVPCSDTTSGVFDNLVDLNSISMDCTDGTTSNDSEGVLNAGTGFFNNLSKTVNNTEDYLGGGYGGFYFEPILLAKSPIHLSFPIIIGGGGISVIPNDYWNWDSFNYQYNYDVFFMVEPGVELEINMVKFFRIALGASYRFTNGVLLNYSLTEAVPIDVMDGFNFYMNFKFGKW